MRKELLWQVSIDKGQLTNTTTMPGIYDHLYVHVIFSVKNSASTIRREWRQPMQRNFAAILTIYGHQMVASAIMHDHVHLLIRQQPRMLLNTIVVKLKKDSTIWLQQVDPEHSAAFKWQKGYAAFSVSRSRTGLVRRYLAHQESYHMRMNLKQEMESLLESKWDDVDTEHEGIVQRISIVADPIDALSPK
jgi:putative transposase